MGSDEPESLGNGWYRYEDDAAAHYYYNTVSEVTQWDAPTAQQCKELDGGVERAGTHGEADELAAYFTDDTGADEGERHQLADLTLRGEEVSGRRPAGLHHCGAASCRIGAPLTPTPSAPSAACTRAEGLSGWQTSGGTTPAPAGAATAAGARAQAGAGEAAGGVVNGLGGCSPEGVDSPEGGSSQFAEAMAMLKQHPDIFGGRVGGGGGGGGERGVATGVTRFDSQFYQSLNALKSQGVDSFAPVVSPEVERTGSKWSANPSGTSPSGVLAVEEEAEGEGEGFLSVDLAGFSEAVDDDDEVPVGLSAPPGLRPRNQEAAEEAEDEAAVCPWGTVTFQAVVFVWYECDGVSQTQPLFPAADGSLRVRELFVAPTPAPYSGRKGALCCMRQHKTSSTLHAAIYALCLRSLHAGLRMRLQPPPM